MAPVTGKFQADFESFYSAVEKAQVSLRSFEGDSSKVEKQINRMADSLSGRHTIQQASLMSEAIREIGGVSKLSTAEASNGLRTLDQAMDKMLRTGEQIPTSMMKQAAELRRVVAVTDQADASVHRITASYRQYDGILQSLGINIGPYVKGLEDIAAFASKGVPALGALGTAAAAVGAAFVGWKIGERIAQTHQLHDAIADGWAVLLGYGDRAQEVALALADANDAQLKYEANLRRQRAVVEEDTNATKAQSDAIKENWRITEGNANALQQLQRDLDAAREKKLADARATFAASQAQSIFAETTETTTETVKAQTEALDDLEARLQEVATAAQEAKASNDAFMNAPTLNNREASGFSGDVRPLSGFALDDVIARFSQAGERDPARALKRALESLESQEGRVRPTDNASFFQLQRDQLLLEQLRQMQGSGKIPGFKDGVENFDGGLAYVHKDEALVRMAKGTSVIPAGKGGGMVFAPVINVNAGLGDRMAIGKAIKDVLIAEFKSFGYRGPVPFGA